MSADAFLDVKASAEGSQPRFLYQIRQNLLVTYRLTSGDRDITWGGYTWTASQVLSSELGISSNTNDYEVTLTLPIRHPLIQRYLAQQSPPRSILITIYEYQTGIKAAEQQWIGETPSISLDMKAHTASMRVPSRITRTLERNISSITAGPECPHVLYGPDCKASDAFTKITTTITRVDGRRIYASLAPYIGDVDRFVGGDVTHTSTGETQTVIGNGNDSGTGTYVDMQAAIPEIMVGDTVVIRLGCAHNMTDCTSTFANLPNYGGFPQIPTYDLFIPGNQIGIFGTPPDTD